MRDNSSILTYYWNDPCRETAHRLDRGKNVHFAVVFALDVFRQIAEIMCSLWPDWPWIADLHPPLKAPSQSEKKYLQRTV